MPVNRNFIGYPLRYTYVDPEAEPEPATLKRLLPRAEIVARQDAMYPLAQDQRSVPLERQVEDRSEAEKRVRLYKPDTGYLLRYTFERINGCWRLTEFEDLSL